MALANVVGFVLLGSFAMTALVDALLRASCSAPRACRLRVLAGVPALAAVLTVTWGQTVLLHAQLPAVRGLALTSMLGSTSALLALPGAIRFSQRLLSALAALALLLAAHTMLGSLPAFARHRAAGVAGCRLTLSSALGTSVTEAEETSYCECVSEPAFAGCRRFSGAWSSRAMDECTVARFRENTDSGRRFEIGDRCVSAHLVTHASRMYARYASAKIEGGVAAGLAMAENDTEWRGTSLQARRAFFRCVSEILVRECADRTFVGYERCTARALDAGRSRAISERCASAIPASR
jgi:hypothetical protein